MIATIDPLEATDYELKVLRMFASTDEIRPSLSCVWTYSDFDGCTYMATDGHTIVVRRSRKHREMPLYEIAKLEAIPIGIKKTAKPPNWPSVVKAPDVTGKPLKVRGINPAYFARVAEVEKAVGRRQADDYVPRAGLSKKLAALERSKARHGAFSEWVIGSHSLDGWYWKISSQSALWEGVIMPRKV